MIRYPSVKALSAIVGNEGREVALAARKILDERTAIPFTVNTGKSFRKLCAVDKLLRNCGVEWVTWECDEHDSFQPDGFHYSNTGDTYAATLVLVGTRFVVSSWGDMVEQHERSCTACRKRTREEMNA